MHKAMVLRASLVPYIYSNARYAYDEGEQYLIACTDLKHALIM